jgi:hypothetical protein
MRRVPSRLLFAALALSLGPLTPGAFAEPGFRHGPPGSHRAFGGHAGVQRWHWGGPRHGAFHHRGYASRGPAFGGYGPHARRFGFHGYGRHGGYAYGYGRPGYASPFYGQHSYGRVFFGHTYGRVGYGQHAFGRHVYGRHVYGRHGYGRLGYGHHGYGSHFYGRGGYGHHGYGRGGYGFFPHSSWVWPSDRYAGPALVAVQSAEPPEPVRSGIPSLADLPVSVGIRSAPTASPVVYVLGSGKRARRSGGIKVVSADRGDAAADAAGSGPRIIRLDAPRAR